MTQPIRMARALTRLREARGLSLCAAARRAGMRRQRWASYEAGFVEPRQRSLERMLEALDAGPAELARALEGEQGGVSPPTEEWLHHLHALLGTVLDLLERVLEGRRPSGATARRREDSRHRQEGSR